MLKYCGYMVKIKISAWAEEPGRWRCVGVRVHASILNAFGYYDIIYKICLHFIEPKGRTA